MTVTVKTTLNQVECLLGYSENRNLQNKIFFRNKYIIFLYLTKTKNAKINSIDVFQLNEPVHTLNL